MRLWILAAAFGLAACQPAPQTPAPASVSQAVSVAPAGSVTQIVNAQRAANGLSAVRNDARLARAAQAHAEDMVAQGYFSHTGANGSRFSQRARAAGYTCAAAENIASGQKTSATVMEDWMNSAGHRRNILLSDARDIGIGRAGNIWVMMLGRGC